MSNPYPKALGIQIPWLNADGATIFKILHYLGKKPSEGTITYVYDFAAGDLISIEKLGAGKCTAMTKNTSDGVELLKLTLSREEYDAVCTNLKEKAAVGRAALEAYKKHNTAETKKVYDALLPAWKEASDKREASFIPFFPGTGEEKPFADVFNYEDINKVTAAVVKIVAQPGGPWAATSPTHGAKEEVKKPKKAKAVPYTAHCRFPIYIKTNTQGEAECAARHAKISVIGKNNMDIGNWRGVHRLPATLRKDRTDEWVVPCYIKVFFDAVDVNGVRNKLDELYVRIKTCWDNGIEKDDSSQICDTCAWSFSILPSIEPDFDYVARNSPKWPWDRVWQRPLEVDDENIISLSDDLATATRKILAQYDAPLLPWEVSHVLNANNIRPESGDSDTISLEEFGTFPNVEVILPQDGAFSHLQLKK